jgi:hypothetical protein
MVMIGVEAGTQKNPGRLPGAFFLALAAIGSSPDLSFRT